MDWDTDELRERAEVGAELLRLLANPTRLLIVHALLDGERSVGDLARTVGAGLTATSQHLNRMRRSGAVTSRRQGSTVYYSLLENHVAPLSMHALLYAGHHEGAERLPSRRTPAGPGQG